MEYMNSKILFLKFKICHNHKLFFKINDIFIMN